MPWEWINIRRVLPFDHGAHLAWSAGELEFLLRIG